MHRWLVLGSLTASFLACQAKEDKERPPILFVGSNGGGVSSGRGGAGGEGGGGSATVDELLLGSVRTFSDSTFTALIPFADPALIKASAADGQGFVEGNYDGLEFAIEGAQTQGSVWALVEPESGSFMPTIGRYEPKTARVTLRVVRVEFVEEIFDTLSVVASPDPGEGHVLVRAIDANGDGVAGIEVNVEGAPFLTYAQNGAASWNEFLETTTVDGLAFAGNITTGFFPGKSAEVAISGVTIELESVIVAAGAVTVLDIVVDN